MPQLLPAKKVVEYYDIPFDFIGLIPVGSTVDTYEAVATVVSGEDLAPSAILGTPTLSGTTKVMVPVTGGEVGVIYNISVRITLDTSARVYEMNGLLAIIP